MKISYKKIAIIAGAAFILMFIFFIFGTPRYQSIKIKNIDLANFHKKLKEASSKDKEIEIGKLIDFKWDECYVFPPYYPSKEAYKTVGAEWTVTKTYIGYLLFHGTENDDQYLMVFKKDSKIVASKVYKLSDLPVVFKLESNKFTNKVGKFTAKNTGNNLKELISLN